METGYKILMNPAMTEIFKTETVAASHAPLNLVTFAQEMFAPQYVEMGELFLLKRVTMEILLI